MAYIDPKYVPEDKTTELEQQQLKFRALLLAQKRGQPETSSYRRRYGNINQGGIDATNWESKLRAQRDADFLRNQAAQNTPRSFNISTGQSSNYKGASSLGASGSFGAFMNAIGEHESSNNYNARNGDSGAMGRFQIMPGNIAGSRGWDYEALGRNITPQQFMRDPKLQDAIARYKLNQYYSKYGARGAAIAWYAGPGALKYSTAALSRGQGKYSSINAYANAIMRRLGF